ncbi:uncharacterized protein ACWYII_046783 isoform 3-T5 [Salvelinus alpinus]
MWRYQRPGFEALLLAELQRQQRCRQFCDTVLRADGVSVPAHSCILFTLSPQLSCALSTSPAPPSGQSHLLDFQAFGACTLGRSLSQANAHPQSTAQSGRLRRSNLRPRPGQHQSDTTKKTPPLPNPPISPIRTPEVRVPSQSDRARRL